MLTVVTAMRRPDQAWFMATLFAVLLAFRIGVSHALRGLARRSRRAFVLGLTAYAATLGAIVAFAWLANPHIPRAVAWSQALLACLVAGLDLYVALSVRCVRREPLPPLPAHLTAPAPSAWPAQVDYY